MRAAKWSSGTMDRQAIEPARPGVAQRVAGTGFDEEAVAGVHVDGAAVAFGLALALQDEEHFLADGMLVGGGGTAHVEDFDRRDEVGPVGHRVEDESEAVAVAWGDAPGFVGFGKFGDGGSWRLLGWRDFAQFGAERQPFCAGAGRLPCGWACG